MTVKAIFENVACLEELMTEKKPQKRLLENDSWLSIDEICQHLDISRDTTYKWLRKGMPAHKFGRHWKFKKNQVDAWIESGGAERKK